MSLLAAVSIATALTAAQDPVTFNRDVAPILFEHCVACHREGGIGPFSLETYAGARERAERIAAMTAARDMPPWLPEPGPEPFAGERRLPDEAIETLRRWSEGGAPEGDRTALPEVPRFAAGWQRGEPDLVVTMSEPYVVPESGRDIFRSFVVPVPTERDRFVEAMEFLPGNHEVVHHAVVLVDAVRSARHLDALDPEPGWAGMQAGLAESPDGHFLGWTPGKTSLEVPDGLTWRLPRGSDLVLQLHLLPRPDAAPVRVQVGFHFGEAPTGTSTRLRLGAKAMDVPAGEEHYRIRDAYRLPVDVELVGLYPHAHYLGKEMRAWAAFEDGRRRSLLHIPDWDFNWQAEYRFARPVSLPAGATLAMEFRYDNSAENPQNPHHPPRRVLYGPESSDEMGDLWVQVVPRREADLAALKLDFARKETAARLAGYRFKLDREPGGREGPLRPGGDARRARRAGRGDPSPRRSRARPAGLRAGAQRPRAPPLPERGRRAGRLALFEPGHRGEPGAAAGASQPGDGSVWRNGTGRRPKRTSAGRSRNGRSSPKRTTASARCWRPGGNQLEDALRALSAGRVREAQTSPLPTSGSATCCRRSGAERSFDRPLRRRHRCRAGFRARPLQPGGGARPPGEVRRGSAGARTATGT